MNILARYIGLIIVGSILVVLFVMIGIDFFIQVIFHIEDVGKGDYHLGLVMLVALLSTPRDAYEFFPMVGLLGSLMGLGTLAVRSELIVMRAAGVSIVQIVQATLVSALLIILLATFVGEVLAPKMLHTAKTKQAVAITKGQAFRAVQGVWLREGDTFIYVNQILNQKRMQGINWYTLDEHQQVILAGYAETATYNGENWVLTEVSESHFTGLESVSAHSTPEKVWEIDLNSEVLGLINTDSQEMNLKDLYHYIQYRQNNDLQVGEFKLVFWQRVLQPFASLIMILFAVPFIFGPLRTVTMGVRIIAGVGAGFAFYIANKLLAPFSMVYQIPAPIAASIPILLFAVLGVWLLLRAR